MEEVCVALRMRMRCEIVIVDDGSTDETQAIRKNARREMREVPALRHRQNAGQSMSVLSGVRSSRAPVIVTLDGDGQNDPAHIPALWQTLKSAPAGGRRLLLAGHRVHRRDRDRECVGEGKSVSVQVALGGRRIKKKKNTQHTTTTVK